MIKMLMAAKVNPGKIEELEQTLDSIKKDLKKSECRMNFILSRQDDQPSNICIAFHWDNEQDFEYFLDENEFRVVCGALKILCIEVSFFCNSLSEKWNQFSKKFPESQRTWTLPEEREMLWNLMLALDGLN